MSSTRQAMLAALIGAQRELGAAIQDVVSSPRQTLAVGGALLAFAVREGESFPALVPLLDPAAHAELVAEHRRISEDLELLDWLVRTTPDSPDVAMLNASLVRRMREHIERDGRLLARAALLASCSL